MSTSAVAPSNFLELGVRRSLLEDLALKIIYINGELSLQDLSDAMKVNRTMVYEMFQRLRKDQLCEVTGMTGPVHRVRTTSGGRKRAMELLESSQYAGPAPVSLKDYIARVRSQSIRGTVVHPPEVAAAFSHLVIEPEVLKQVGTAITSGRAIFLYGSTGSGKTTIAETLTTIFHRNLVWLPYAVEVDGQIITVYDAHVHQRATEPTSEFDARWVLCHRPRVVVGGELTIEMLDLQFNPLTRFYTGPLQMKANNGVLIIDDFGRQRVAPSELLNRWVVPLDRQVDFLQLAGGKKIEMPFDMFVVFATNMDVTKLVDDVFLRRIQTKIRVDYVTREQFKQIFENVCRELGVESDPALVDHAIDLITTRYSQPLRACYPRDVVNQVIWSAKYDGADARLSPESIEEACRNYFVTPA